MAQADDLRALSRLLRRQADGKDRLKAMRAELRTAAAPMVPAVRSAIRAIPNSSTTQRSRAGRRRPTMRASLARAVTLQVRTGGKRAGVALFMNPRKMPDGLKAMPAYFEGTPGYQRFRHPVFGADVWVTQRPHPYFTRTVRSADRQLTRVVDEIIERIRREVEG
ncbi:hypothetical protein [Actinomadura sp. NEAU-AAG7]|uniref:hypothetical protein n=1 Tax=Actinomadura sp. NEAU-AAG7 TaxID=2839640 RepID=UPI001BE416CD|nr:hypothetical protein [Actinomadura sp. NEAU-AAG7]MBT2213458.1 hypothetical protein [Actinomadura sp. NEAU-AAG7]